MKSKCYSCLLLFLCVIFYSQASGSTVDSLFKVLKEGSDTNYNSIYSEIFELVKDSPDTGIVLMDKALKLAEKHNTENEVAYIHNLKGHLYEHMGKVSLSTDEFEKAYDLFYNAGNIESATTALQNMAAMLIDDGKFEEASKHLFNALRLTESHNLRKLEGTVLNNIGLLFFNQKDWEKSIYYYKESIPIRIETNDLDGLALLYNNIGISYYYLNILDSVLVNFERSLEMYVKLGNKLGQTRPLSNIGEIYYIKGDYDKALEYYNRSIKIEKELGYKSGYAVSLMEVGKIYAEVEDIEKALEYQYEGFDIVKDLGIPAKIMDACYYLYETYDKINNSDSALKYYIQYTVYKDSLFNIEKTKTINELDKIYETDKKEQQIALQNVKIRNNKIKMWALTSIIILILGFVIQVLRVNRNKKKTNILLKQKNKLLAENNRQITNSITYASFIQAAILPPLELFKESFPEHFIFFKPKDIVSGDFYWITKTKNQIIIAVADCTGHGVPGAFMSMLGITLLNEIINIQHITSTNKILDMLREKIIDALRQKSDTYDSRDGMDISVCSLNMQNNQLEFSGAYRPVIIFSDKKMRLIEGNKMPIGFHKTRNSPFNKTTYKFKSGDIFYLHTDGFPDQFGGEAGKKYTRQKFRKFLDSIHQHPLDLQKDKLEKEFNNWKGNMDQIDDITVLGIKV